MRRLKCCMKNTELKVRAKARAKVRAKAKEK